jgi:glycosyltransferase involved in cell wall biosynthesis
VKIVHIEAGRHLYGGARQVELLMGGLASRGIEQVLLCPPGQPLAPLAKRLPAASVVELPMHGDADLALVPRLMRVLAKLKPDLVHVHSRRGADAYGGLAARLCRIPAVLTRRVDSVEPRVWSRVKYRSYRAVVAISRAVAAELERDAGFDPAFVRLIPSAVDAQRFRPDAEARARLQERFDLAAGDFLLGMSAQLIARKGHEYAFAALGELRARHPEVRLLCFGRGPLQTSLREGVARLGLTECVQFAGFHDDMHNVLPGLDAFVHPAEREGLGVAVLEAMSAGLPVVASAVGGIVDALSDGVEGLLVPPAAPLELACALQTLIENTDLRRAMGDAGRARVRRDFSVAAMSDAYLNLYRALLGERHAYV